MFFLRKPQEIVSIFPFDIPLYELSPRFQARASQHPHIITLSLFLHFSLLSDFLQREMREPQQTKRSHGFKFAILTVFCNSLSVRTLHFALTAARTSQALQTCRIALFSRIFRTAKATKQQSESYALALSKLSNSITKAFSSLR